MSSIGWMWAYVVLAGAGVAILAWVVSAWVGKRAARRREQGNTGGSAPRGYGGSSVGGVAPYAGGDDSGFFLTLQQQISSWGDSGSNADCGGGGHSGDCGGGHCGGADGSCGSSCGGSD